MSVEVPSEYAPPEDDYSPFVPVALLIAMRRAEPLQIDGPVSARLLTNLTLAQEIISALNGTLRRVQVRAVAARDARAKPAAGRACCFSRGVDSTYSAAVERPSGDEFDCLVHWRDFQLIYSERTVAREVELVHEAARRLDLPVVVVSSDVPMALADVVDFNDATSAMLASVLLSLPGLGGRFAVPSPVGYADLGPLGTHPLLDGLWSTERVGVEHDSCVPGRDDKVEWLVRNRPDLLALLHVCMEQDSVENCGRCAKCLWTMLLLHLHGGLAESSFPDRVDPGLVKRTPRPAVHHLRLAERVHEQLGGRPGDVGHGGGRGRCPRSHLAAATRPASGPSRPRQGCRPRCAPAQVWGRPAAGRSALRRARGSPGRPSQWWDTAESQSRRRPADRLAGATGVDHDNRALGPRAARVEGTRGSRRAPSLGRAPGPRRKPPAEAGPEARPGPAGGLAPPRRRRWPARALRRGAPCA